MNKEQIFTNTLYDSYISTHIGEIYNDIHRSYQSKYYLWKSYFKNALPKDLKAPIIEIGCGMGQNLYALKKFGYKNVLGFDISRECVEFCKQKGFHVVWSTDVLKLSKQAEYKKKFEYIIVYDLLEHFMPMDAVSFLRSLRQLAENNAQICISFPNGEFPFNMPQRYIDVSHKFLYTSASLSQLLRLSGMKIEYITSIPSFSLDDDRLILRYIKRFILFPLSQMSIFIMRLFLATFGVSLQYPKPQLFSLARFV